jgi:hypothetical protein
MGPHRRWDSTLACVDETGNTNVQASQECLSSNLTTLVLFAKETCLPVVMSEQLDGANPVNWPVHTLTV